MAKAAGPITVRGDGDAKVTGQDQLLCCWMGRLLTAV